MSDLQQIAMGSFFFIGLIIVALFAMNWRMKRAFDFVIKDLQWRKATDLESAVPLPYLKRTFINFGMRDFRPKAIQTLLENGTLFRTQDNRFYLNPSVRPR